MNFLSSLFIKVFVLALLFSCVKTKDTAPDFGLDFLVEGLKGVVSISVNSSEPIAFNKDGLFPLHDNILHDHNFEVSIVSQPEEKYCDISPNKGEARPGEKTVVKIYCQDNEVTLKGLLIKESIDVEGLEVSLSDSNVVTFSKEKDKSSVEFEFPKPLDLFSDYEVKIKAPDNNQSCSVVSDNAKGTVTNKLEKIIILCGSVSYKMKGKITGEFQDTGIIALKVNNDYDVKVDLSQGQSFVVNDGNDLISFGVNYEVRTIDVPSGYTCDTVSGKIDSSNFQNDVPVDIEIPCHRGKYDVKGEISGLTLVVVVKT